MENLEKLKAIPIFAGAGNETLSALSKLFKEEKYADGEYIVREGDSADSMYILQSGELEVRKVISRDPETFKTLAIIEENDIFGEMSIFGEGRPEENLRSADVVTRGDTIVWKLKSDKLFKMMDDDPAGGVKTLLAIMQILTRRIRSLNSELAVLYEMSRLLPGIRDMAEFTDAVFNVVNNAIKPAESGFIAMLNIFNEEFDIHQASGVVEERHIEYSDPVTVWMFENKAPIIVNDTASDPEFKDKFYAGKSFIASPFIHNDKLLGFVLFSNSQRKDAFGYNHMILISTLCTQVAAKLRDLDRAKDEALRQRLQQGKTQTGF